MTTPAARESIREHGLQTQYDQGEGVTAPGVYLSPEVSPHRMPYHDVWKVDTSGLTLHPDHHGDEGGGEVYSEHDIHPSRLTLHIPARESKTAEKAEGWKDDHAWLPHDRIFGAGKGGLDPRLFDEHKVMRPEVEQDTLGDLASVWNKYDLHWRDWARVYLAGSEASWWWGNNDFDTLIGIDHDKARAAVPAWEHLGDDEIDSLLTHELHNTLNDEDYQPPWDNQVWHRTFFCNPDSWDIRRIKPYAAYDITRRLWAVEPVHADASWGPTQLPEALFSEGEGLVKQIDAIEGLPEKERIGRGAALWDYLHNDRRRAFSDQGDGVFDPGNAVWKYLDMAPSEPLTRLLALKRAALDAR